MAGKQKFTTRIDGDLLAWARAVAEREGRPLRSVIEEALVDLERKKSGQVPRPEVMAHYEESLKQFGSLYDRMA